MSCFNCRQGFLRDGSRCPLCKGTAWIEILGAGMVDPNLYGYVRRVRLRRRAHQGFAWGMGIERIAFLKHGVPDLRMFFENDLRLLEQLDEARGRHDDGAPRMRSWRMLLLFWLTDYVDPGLEAAALAMRLDDDRDRGRARLHARRHGAGQLRRRARARAASSTPTPTG